MLTTCLHPNTTEIAAKILDGEAILINLSTGVYYSMDKVGAVIWSLISDGCSEAEIVAAIAAAYEVDSAQVNIDVEQVIADLIREKIVTVLEGAQSPDNSSFPSPAVKAPYETPRLNIYRDMSDLLALDPPIPGLVDLSDNKEK